MSSTPSTYVQMHSEWERHREEITRLYLLENRTLKEVQEIMEAQFGLKATRRMFVSRIAKWGIKKNYSADEKDHILAQMVDAATNGQELLNLSFKGQPIKNHRVVRHMKMRGILEAPNVAPSIRVVNRDAARIQIQIPTLIGTAAPAEVILRVASQFILSLTETAPVARSHTHLVQGMGPSASASPALELGAMTEPRTHWADLGRAIYLLRIGEFHLGWVAFHGAWGELAKTALSDPATLLRQLLTISTPNYLGNLPELRREILGFMMGLVQIQHGATHPLAQICSQLRSDNENSHALETTLDLMKNVFEERLGPCHHETVQSHLALVVCQIRNANLNAAEQWAEALLQRARSSAELVLLIPKAMTMLAYVLKEQRRFNEAITLRYQILGQWSMLLSETDYVSQRENLAELHRFEGHLEAESQHLEMALEASRRAYGPSATETQHILDKLHFSLNEQGRYNDALRFLPMTES